MSGSENSPKHLASKVAAESQIRIERRRTIAVY